MSLMLVMAVTRSSHLGGAADLPDASWAVFFLAAFYLQSLMPFAAFMLTAWLIDLSAVQLGGVDAFCLTPAYFTLVPAYGALWLAGLWYARVHRERASTVPRLLGIFGVGVVACELLSSGGFYLYSGYFEQPGWAQYLERTVTYFPSFLATAFFYLALAVLVHVAVRAGARRAGSPAPGAGEA